MKPHPFTVAIKRAMWRNQWQWFLEASRHPWIAHIGPRQCGKDRVWGAVPASRCLMTTDLWNMFSATQRHAYALLREVRGWIGYLSDYARAQGFAVPQVVKPESKAHIELTNGSMIFSHPATLRAAVGNRGSAILNEAGRIPGAQDLYEGMWPFVNAQLELGKQANLIVISNASHQGSWLHNFWTCPSGWQGAKSTAFAKFRTTYAMHLRAQGRSPEYIKAAEARIIEAIGAAAFGQWYNCDWRSLAGRYISDEVLGSASKDHEASVTKARSSLLGHTLGYDPGRSMDPAAITKILLGTDNKRTALDPWYSPPGGIPYAAQYAELERQTLTDGVNWGLGVDGTGPQCAIVERIQEVLPEISVYGVPFGYTSKWRIFGALRDAMETGLLKIPDHPRVKMELRQIVYGRTEGGQPRLQWPRAKDGEGEAQHGDVATSLALGNWVVEQSGAVTW